MFGSRVYFWLRNMLEKVFKSLVVKVRFIRNIFIFFFGFIVLFFYLSIDLFGVDYLFS